MKKFILNGILFSLLCLLIYLIIPLDDKFKPRYFEPLPNRTGVLKENNLLSQATLITDKIFGPEDLEFVDEDNLVTGDVHLF